MQFLALQCVYWMHGATLKYEIEIRGSWIWKNGPKLESHGLNKKLKTNPHFKKPPKQIEWSRLGPKVVFKKCGIGYHWFEPMLVYSIGWGPM